MNVKVPISVVVVFIFVSVIATSFIVQQGKLPLSQSQNNKFIGLEENVRTITEDIKFYRNIDKYASLLEQSDFDILQGRFDEISNDIDKGLEGTAINLLIAVAIHEVLQDENAQNIVLKLRKTIEDLEKSGIGTLDEDQLFARNTECAKLIPGITAQLSGKYSAGSLSKTSESEELDFIFYSPTLKNCLYSTAYRYSNSFDDYYTTTAKRIYNAATGSKIKDLITSYYSYPYLGKDEADKQGKNNTREYHRFILENSGYSIDLLDGQSYFF